MRRAPAAPGEDPLRRQVRTWRAEFLREAALLARTEALRIRSGAEGADPEGRAADLVAADELVRLARKLERRAGLVEADVPRSEWGEGSA